MAANPEALALQCLGNADFYVGDLENALAWARQAQRIDPASIPGRVARKCGEFFTMTLVELARWPPANAAARTGWPVPGKQATCTVMRNTWR